MDALEHFYEVRVFKGVPELFTPSGDVKPADMRISFPLNVGTLSDATLVDHKEWRSMKW